MVNSRIFACTMLVVLALMIPPVLAQETLLAAFPGAEGFGAATPGGRGGDVHFVTSLDDYVPGVGEPIPGSLRAAVDAKGPRYVLFRVGGTITLKSDLWIREPFITIAGQSAPGGGIAIRDYQVVLATNDVVLRHLRIRSGDRTKKEQMSVGIFGGNNSIIDHCSMSWAIDEVMSAFGAHNLTVQWSTIAEGLSRSFHPKGEHSKGSILDGTGGITVHHSIYAHNAARNARVNTIVLDFRNNVVYNWGYRGGYTTAGPAFINYVNNYFKAGPDTKKGVRTRVFEPGDDSPRLFFVGNVLADSPEQTANNQLLIRTLKNADKDAFAKLVFVNEAFAAPEVATDTAEAALERVLAKAGATLPLRDSADARLMEEIRTGTGRIIDSPNDVGGWPELAAGEATPDSDNDGLPDAWEERHNLAEALEDTDDDGYPNLEEFLNATDPNKAEIDNLLDAESFHTLQQDAIDLCVDAGRAFKALNDARAKERDAQRDATLAAMAITLNPREGGRPGGQIIDLGGEASIVLEPIPAGTFLMGSPESEGGAADEHPQQPVTISRDFHMSATMITNQQYNAIMGKTERRDEAGEENFPAEEVNWFDAMEFCERLGKKLGRTFRLPTEAEWEYACRAGTTTAFYTGDTITSDQANFDGQEATRYNPAGVYRGDIIAVAQFPPNSWGLYDMHGNQSQYCLDNVGRKYTTEPVIDPMGPEGDGAKVMRGGRAKSKAEFIRSAARYGYAPGIGYCFRIVMLPE
jgi:hypothetical protein